jgi:hypothetical protein
MANKNLREEFLSELYAGSYLQNFPKEIAKMIYDYQVITEREALESLMRKYRENSCFCIRFANTIADLVLRLGKRYNYVVISIKGWNSQSCPLDALLDGNWVAYMPKSGQRIAKKIEPLFAKAIQRLCIEDDK